MRPEAVLAGRIERAPRGARAGRKACGCDRDGCRFGRIETPRSVITSEGRGRCHSLAVRSDFEESESTPSWPVRLGRSAGSDLQESNDRTEAEWCILQISEAL